MTAEPVLLDRVPLHLGLASFSESLPHVAELDLLSSRALPARRTSFLAGRLAARRALRAKWGDLPEDVRIDRAESGQPIVAGAHVSITHTAGWALAVASDSPCGIDLVELEELPVAMRSDVFTEEELDAFAKTLPETGDSRFADCIAFAFKEAALKWLGTGMAIPLPSVSACLRELSPVPYGLVGRVLVQHRTLVAELEAHVFELCDDVWCVWIGSQRR